MQNLIDKQAIYDLQVRYSVSIDNGAYDTLDEVFTPDVVADYGHAGVHRDVAGIKDACRLALEPLDATQHTNSNHWAEIEGDTARAGCYFIAHMFRKGTPGGEHFRMGGSYEDQLARTEQGWRITHRIMRLSWSEGNDRVRFDR